MTKPKPPAAASPSRILKVVAEPGKSHEALVAEVVTGACVPAAIVVTDFAKGALGEAPLGEVLGALKDHACTIKNGDLTRVEAMLSGQASALNTMFAELARRGAINMGEYLGAAETYLKLALKAQSQCRATLETLAMIKSPPVVIAKQANIAHGPQQVNNESNANARAGELENQPNKLLDQDNGERLDARTTGTTSESNPAMATLEVIDRPKDRKRQGKRQP